MIARILHIAKLPDDTIHYSNLIFVIKAADVLDLDGSWDMLAACRALVEGGALKILVDMEGLDFIDSSGIGALISIAKLIRSKKGDIALYAVPPHIETIFRPVNLQRFIALYRTLDEAVNFFRFV
jgi:anti-sigma B factor antagonist